MYMSKYAWMFGIAVFIALITMASQSLLVTPTIDIGDGVATGVELTGNGLLAFVSTYIKILTFSLPGFPAWITLLVFLPLNLAFGLLLIDTVAPLFGK